MKLTIRHRGRYNKTEEFLNKLTNREYLNILDKYGQKGVEALRNSTPIDTGKTANSWYYEIERSYGKTSLYWSNSNINDGVVIAIILQYGHGTGNGGYVRGSNYINPAIRPVFDELLTELWKEVVGS